MSLLDLLLVVIEYRRIVLAAALAGAVLAGAASLTSRRQFLSVAAFVPEEGTSGVSGFAATARQLGLSLPGGSKGWSPALYVEVLKSRQMLESIARDTVVVEEEGGRRVAMLDLLEVTGPTAERRLARGVLHLDREVVRVSESRNVGSVTVRARTPWASVSQAIVRRLLERVNEYNLSTRQSQASAEARFAETMADSAAGELRRAEQDLQRFLEQNRDVSASPALQAQQDRLRREVSMRQELYGSLVMSRDEARLRRVRDTPVISITEPPTRPAIGESRGTVLRTLLGAFAGTLIVLGSLLLGWVIRAPRERATASDLRRALHGALPSWIARRIAPAAE